jgi:HSP20 family molecular chaperone IbpA
MIKRKTCNNCNEKIKNSYNFCPSCGIQTKEQSKDWGMLGKNDKEETKNKQINLFNGGITGGIMNKMIGSAMKMLEKEMQKELGPNKKMPINPNTKIKLMINGKEIMPQKIQKTPTKKENIKILPIEFSNENLKKWSNSKKEEPKSNLKRIGDKIEYEIEIPGVQSIKDISIIKLEKSLEIKAIAKDKSYQKIIPLDLPLKKYSLLQGKLTLELDASI